MLRSTQLGQNQQQQQQKQKKKTHTPSESVSKDPNESKQHEEMNDDANRFMCSFYSWYKRIIVFC